MPSPARNDHRIVPATPADVDAIVRLLGILFTQERELEPDARKQRRGVERILANPAIARIFVARDAADRVVGSCNVLFSESTFLGGPVAWLEDVIVDPAERGRGIGGALLDHVVGFARAEGLMRVTLLTDHDNAVAQSLYASRGFERSSMIAMRVIFDRG